MGAGMEVQTFNRLSLLGRRFYFRIVDAANWEVLAQSEGYTRPGARNETAKRLADALGAPLIPERKTR